MDRIVGRDVETERVIQILNRRQKNNPCLIGEPGVGKTAIAEGLAQRIVDWRTENGPFTDAAQLLEVDGIGQTVLESIQDFIVTEDTQE